MHRGVRYHGHRSWRGRPAQVPGPRTGAGPRARAQEQRLGLWGRSTLASGGLGWAWGESDERCGGHSPWKSRGPGLDRKAEKASAGVGGSYKSLLRLRGLKAWSRSFQSLSSEMETINMHLARAEGVEGGSVNVNS